VLRFSNQQYKGAKDVPRPGCWTGSKLNLRQASLKRSKGI